jgi:hypothetical protein
VEHQRPANARRPRSRPSTTPSTHPPRAFTNNTSQLLYISVVCSAASFLFLKAAVLVQWSRIFVPAGTRPWLFWALNTLLVLNTLLYTAGLFVAAFGCRPISRFWNALIEGTCISENRLQITTSAINAGIDIAIFIVPQRVIWSLQLTLGRRIGLAMMFSLGLLFVLTRL